MKILLIIFAVIGVVALILLAVVVFWLKRLFGGVRGQLEQLVSNSQQGNPFRISLRPYPQPSWEHADTVETVTLGFEQMGYQRCGDFEIPEMRPTMPDGEPSPQPVLLRALHLKLLGTYAVIYAIPNFGLLLDVFGELSDGRSLTITSNKATGLDRPDFAKTIYLAAAQDQLLGLPREMHQRLLAESQGLEFVPHTAAEFASHFVRAYQRDIDWMIERGGQSADEIRRIARNAGQAEPNEGAIATVQQVWRTRVDEFLLEQATQQLLQNLSAQQWEAVRDHLFLVYDSKPLDDLRDYLTELWLGDAEDADDDREATLRAKLAAMYQNDRGRAAFAKGRALLPAERQPRLLLTLEQPVPIDVYATAAAPD